MQRRQANAVRLQQRISVGGHCASLTVSNYGNRVQADSIDIIMINNYGDKFFRHDVSGDSNTATYHSGSTKITQSGYDISVKQG